MAARVARVGVSARNGASGRRVWHAVLRHMIVRYKPDRAVIDEERAWVVEIRLSGASADLGRFDERSHLADLAALIGAKQRRLLAYAQAPRGQNKDRRWHRCRTLHAPAVRGCLLVDLRSGHCAALKLPTRQGDER